MKTKAQNLSKVSNLKNYLLSLGLVFSLCVIYPTVSNAQVGFTVGPKAGISFNSFDSKDNGNFSGNTAWAAGIFANAQFGQVFSIQPELLIHQKGAAQTVNNNKNVVRLNYFSVPLLFKLSVPLGGTVFPHVLAGPVYNYRLNAQYTAADGGVAFNDGDLKRSEIAGAVGAGLDFIQDNIFVNLDGRYNVGLSDVNSDVINVRNRNFTIMLGVGYRFGGPR